MLARNMEHSEAVHGFIASAIEAGEGVEWKRKSPCGHGSKLTETYSWRHRQGVLLPRL